MLEREIAEFGRRLGMQGLALSDRGVTLSVEGVGALSMEVSDTAAGRELVLSLADAAPVERAECLKALLAAASWRSGNPYQIAVGSLHERIAVMTRLPADTLSASDIENAIRFLADFLHRNA